MRDWSEFNVDVATSRDAELVLALREKAARWLTAQNLDQWSPGDVAASELADSFEEGQVFLLRHGTELAGTVMVLWADPVIWGEQAVPAGYIHNLVVARSFAGQGLGRRLLQWAEDHVVASGRSIVRLDCVATNRALRELYESVGYHWVGDEDLPLNTSTRSTSLYEKLVRIS